MNSQCLEEYNAVCWHSAFQANYFHFHLKQKDINAYMQYILLNTYHIVMRFFFKWSKIKDRLPIANLRKLRRSLSFSILARIVAVDSITEDHIETVEVDSFIKELTRLTDLIINDITGTVIADSIMKDLARTEEDGQIMGDRNENIKKLNFTKL